MQERFLAVQADPFTGVKGEEKSACSVRNDVRGSGERKNEKQIPLFVRDDTRGRAGGINAPATTRVKKEGGRGHDVSCPYNEWGQPEGAACRGGQRVPIRLGTHTPRRVLVVLGLACHGGQAI